MIDVTPVFVTFPFEYERPPENVVVATHVGTPLTEASMRPPVPIPSFDRVFEFEAYNISPVVYEV